MERAKSRLERKLLAAQDALLKTKEQDPSDNLASPDSQTRKGGIRKAKQLLKLMKQVLENLETATNAAKSRIEELPPAEVDQERANFRQYEDEVDGIDDTRAALLESMEILRENIDEAQDVDIIEDAATNQNEMDQIGEDNVGIDPPQNQSYEEFNRTFSQDPPHQQTQCVFRIPQLSLPKFSGASEDFLQFWQIFETSVDSKAASDVEKLSVLLTSLDGSAKQSVAGYPIIAESYPLVKTKLMERFGNTDKRKDLLFHTLFETNCPSEDTATARRTLDKIESILLQLENIGESTNISAVRTHIERQFPTWVLRCLFTIKTLNEDNWTIQKLMSALNKIISASEENGNYSLPSEITTLPMNHSTSNETSSQHKWDRTPIKCIFCQSTQGHESNDCRIHDTPEKRKNQVKQLRLCFRCGKGRHSARECRGSNTCDKCHGRHVTALCQAKAQERAPRINQIRDNTQNTKEQIDLLPLVQERNDVQPTIVSSVMNGSSNNSKVLMTVEAIIRNAKTGKRARILCFLDSGAECTFITEKLEHELSLDNMGSGCAQFKGFNESTYQGKYNTVQFELLLEKGNSMKVSAKTTPSILREMHSVRLDGNQKIVNEVRAPSMIIGIDYFWTLVRGKCGQMGPLEVTETELGKVLSGSLSITNNGLLQLTLMEDKSLTEAFIKSTELELIGIRDDPTVNDDEESTLTFQEKAKLVDGRIEVPLPWKPIGRPLPSNFGLAKKQLHNRANRINDADKNAINDQVKTWMDQGVIEEVGNFTVDSEKTHFLPYLLVRREGKKPRLCHNASAHTKGNPSLNDALRRGPININEILPLTIRLREYAIPVIGDLEAAFNQIVILEEDRDCTRFLLSKDWSTPLTDDNLRCYRFKRLNFGLKCSPFLLEAAISRFLSEDSSQISKEILRDIYVDNVLLSANSNEEAIRKMVEAKQIFEKLGFNLRDFLSPSPELREEWKCKTESSFLGTSWNLEKDSLHITVPAFSLDPMTKRKLLSHVAALYDPLGIFSPITLNLRNTVRTTWENHWDDILPEAVTDKLRNVFDKETIITIPRSLGSCQKVDLHVFVDASGVGIAAIAYFKDMLTGEISLICAKARLTPRKETMKKTTIPRLELTAAQLGTKLADYIRSCSSKTILRTTLWSDSTCVLHWIKGSKEHGTYVNNRLQAIRSVPSIQFNYVRTTDNPADIGSRGCSPTELNNHTIWWNGPNWLKEDEEKWPNDHIFTTTEKESDEYDDEPEESQEIMQFPISTVTEFYKVNPIDYNNFRLFDRLINTTVLVFLFIKKVVPMKPKTPTNWIRNEVLPKNRCELEKYARKLIIRREQELFPPSKAQMAQMRIYKDNDGLSKCKGRLANSGIPDPLFLHKDSEIVRLIINTFHEKFGHASASYTVAQIRMFYWIPGLKTLARRHIRRCSACARETALPFRAPEPPALPSSRLLPAPPFSTTGLDTCGPFNIRSGADIIKTWIVIFTCFVTRATHTEVVGNLTSATFVNAFRRFVARRGMPHEIYSDNGTQFMGALSFMDNFESQEIFSQAKGVKWRTIPARVPWFGGLYERMVGVLKTILRKLIGRKLVTIDEFNTLIIETECFMNCRPLVETPDRALRPIDFINGLSPGFPFGHYDDVSENATTDPLHIWKEKCESTRRSWKIFQEEYLAVLRSRPIFHINNVKKSIGRSPEIGEVVFIRDEGPRHSWKIGRIVELCESSDQEIRSAVVETGNKRRTRRSIAHLLPLEGNLDKSSENTFTTLEATDQVNTKEPENAKRTNETETTDATKGSPNDSDKQTTSRGNSRYNLRTNPKKIMLAIIISLSLWQTSFACSGPLLYTDRGQHEGFVVNKDRLTHKICWISHNCGTRVLRARNDPKTSVDLCGPRVKCPDWADDCNIGTFLTSMSPENIQTLLIDDILHICSFTPTTECPTLATQQVHWIGTTTGHKYKVKHLKLRNIENNQTICFGTGSITGSPRYCAQGTCFPNGTQFCTIPANEATVFVTSSGAEIPINAWSSRTVNFYSQDTEVQETAKECTDLKATCANGIIQLNYFSECRVDAAEICVENRCRTIPINHLNDSIAPPIKHRLRDQIYNLQLWKQGKKAISRRIICEKTNICSLSRCLMCLNSIRNPSCISYNLVPKVVEANAWIILIFIFWVAKRLFRNMFIGRCRREASLPKRRRRQVFDLIPRRIVITAVVACLIEPIQSCDEYLAIRSLTRTCKLTPNGVKTCEFDSISLFTVKDQQVTCLQLMDDTNSTLETIQVEATPSLSCQRVTSHYTQLSEIHISSVRRCHGQGSCPQDCSSDFSNNKLNEFKSTNIYPGKVTCRRKCGCLFCGCLSCSKSCEFSRIYATPIEKNVLEIFKCRWRSESIVKVQTSRGITVVRLAPGESTEVEKMKIQVNSVSTNPSPETTWFARDLTNDITFILDERAVVAAKLIKCSDDKLQNCGFSEQLCQCSEDEDDPVQCQCPTNHHLRTSKQLALPQERNGLSILPARYGPYIRLEGASTISLDSKKKTVSTLVNNSKCKVNIIATTGCYQCESGAAIEYFCSTESGGIEVASLTCKSAKTFLKCSTKSSKLTATIHLNEPHVQENCEVRCSGGTTEAEIKADLFYLEQTEIKDASWIKHTEDESTLWQQLREALTNLLEWKTMAIVASLALLLPMFPICIFVIYRKILRLFPCGV